MNDNKKLLFERMHKVAGMPLNENYGDNDQAIIDDILNSTNEDVGGWWNKFVNYGKKGLLTAGIIMAVALSSQAQGQNKGDDVVRTGMELASNDVKTDIYNFYIGATMTAIEDFLKSGRLEDRNLGNELIKYYVALKNGNTPKELSRGAANMKKIIDDMYKGGSMSDDLIKSFIEKGRSVKDFDFNAVGV